MERRLTASREMLHDLGRAARAGVVSVADAAASWGESTRSAAIRLARLHRGGWVRRVKRGVYYFPPLEASAKGVPEDSWVLADELFAPCYIAGWTAAGYWSLTDQLFRTTFVASAASIRRSDPAPLDTPFKVATVPADRISGFVEVWRGGARLRVSTPERTVVDALRHPAWVGGIRHLGDVLGTYAGSVPDAEAKLVAELCRSGNGAAHKRAGYLAEQLWPEATGLIEIAWAGRTAGVVKLDPSIKGRGRMTRKWGLWINAEVETGRLPETQSSNRGRVPEVRDKQSTGTAEVRVGAYSDQELEGMLLDLESDLVERKQTLGGDAPTKVREAACGFANDLPDHRRPGVVFIGATDNGRPTGLEVTDELLRQLADIKTDGNIVPPPTLTVAKRSLHGHTLAVVTVWPSDSPPVRCRGRIVIRIGPRRGIASPQDERILNEKRRHGDRPFDIRPVRDASLADLERRRFEDEYLPVAFAPEVIAANDRTYEQRLAATKMVLTADEPTPTVLGLLVASPRTRDFIPGSYVQFMRIAGTELADPIVDEQQIDGPLADMIRRLDEKLTSHNRTIVDLVTASREKRSSLYPMAALQQLTRNAIMHRTYEATNAPVRITWYDDRIEIMSPGGPYGSVTVANFGQPGVSDYRNPNVAEALKVLGFVQRFGVGIATARRELDTNGNPPPEFQADASYVNVVVRAGP